MMRFTDSYVCVSDSGGRGFSRNGDSVNKIERTVGSRLELCPSAQDDESLRISETKDVSRWPTQVTTVSVEVRNPTVLPLRIHGVEWRDFYSSKGYDSGYDLSFVDTIHLDADGTMARTRKYGRAG